MMKIRGDKPVGVIIHIYMEILQGNSLCSYLYLNQVKLPCFSFSLFSSTKLENKGLNQVLPRFVGGISTSGVRKGKGVGR
jgi:hypothetical protein